MQMGDREGGVVQPLSQAGEGKLAFLKRIGHRILEQHVVAIERPRYRSMPQPLHCLVKR